MLAGIVGEADPRISDEAREGDPGFQHVADEAGTTSANDRSALHTVRPLTSRTAFRPAGQSAVEHPHYSGRRRPVDIYRQGHGLISIPSAPDGDARFFDAVPIGKKFISDRPFVGSDDEQ